MKKKLSLSAAQQVADGLVVALAPYCETIEIAGSIRRRKAEVGDVELLAVPKITRRQVDLFGDVFEEENALDEAVGDLLVDGVFDHRLDSNGRHAFGQRYKRLIFDGVGVDLFSCLPPAQYGVLLAIRTGPADFSQKLVTAKRFGGLLPDGWKVKDGQLFDEAFRAYPVPDEATLFQLLKLDYIAPHDRTA